MTGEDRGFCIGIVALGVAVTALEVWLIFSF